MSQRYTGMPTWKKVVAGAVAAAATAAGIGAAVHYAVHPSWMAWTPPTPGAAPTNTPTNTPIPPTATATNTPIPPTATATNTPIPPTATATATSTNTPTGPTATPTNTPTAGSGTATFTPIPTATGTAATGPEFTPAPTPTINAQGMPTPAMQVASFVGPSYQQTPVPTATFVPAATLTPNPSGQFADLYIAPTGVDTAANADCTQSASPCQSLYYASQFAKPGFTIHLASGYYPPQQLITGVSGTDDAHRITITGPVDNSAVIEHPYPAADAEQQRPLIRMIQNRYITWQYLTVIGMRTGRDDYNSARYNNGADESVNCVSYDYPECAPGAADIADDDGGDTDYPGIDYDHLIVGDTTGSCIKVAGGAVVSNSYLFNCGVTNDTFVHGIYVTVGNVTVANNQINGASSYGITMHQTGAAVTNVKVYDNNLYGAYRSAPIGSDAGGYQVWIYDNMIHDLGTNATDAIQLAGGNVAFGNVLWAVDHQRKFGLNPTLGGDNAATGHGPTVPQYILNNTVYSAACCAANAMIGGMNGTNGVVYGPIVARNNVFAETTKDDTNTATFQYPYNPLFNTTEYLTPGPGTPTPTPQPTPQAYPTVGPNDIGTNDYLGIRPYPNGSCNGVAACTPAAGSGVDTTSLGATDPQFTQGTPTPNPTPLALTPTPLPYNLQPKSTSPVKDGGVNVGLSACLDGLWPIGAYCPVGD